MEKKPTKKIMSEAEMKKAAETTLQKLQGQDRVKFLVLPDGSKDKNAIVKINGARFVIPKGVEVELPKDVYELVKEKYEAVRKLDEATSRYANMNLGNL